MQQLLVVVVKIFLQITQHWHPQYRRECPICILWGVGPTRFSKQSVRCGWPVLGTTSVCIGFNLRLLCSRRIPVSERGSHYWHQVFKIDFQNKIWRTQLKSTKKVHAGLKLCMTDIDEVGNVFHSGIFQSSFKVFWGVIDECHKCGHP